MAWRPDPSRFTVSVLGAKAWSMTVPVLSELTPAEHSTVCVEPPVKPALLFPYAVAQALPNSEVELLGMTYRSGSEELQPDPMAEQVVHVIDSLWSVDSASPVTSSQFEAALPLPSKTVMFVSEIVEVEAF